MWREENAGEDSVHVEDREDVEELIYPGRGVLFNQRLESLAGLLTPASLAAAPTGLATLAQLTQCLRTGLSYAAAAQLGLGGLEGDAIAGCECSTHGGSKTVAGR